MNRRRFLQVTGATLALQAAKPTFAAKQEDDGLQWFDVRDLGVEGQGFTDTAAPFERLPARAQNVVRPEVWWLSRQTAGMNTRFLTDAPKIHVRYTLLSDTLALPHMPATGVSGLDLYTDTDEGWRWLATHQPKAQSASAELVSGLADGRGRYQLNFPLYNGVKSLEIGIPAGTSLEPVPPRTEGAILFYGTSITQGACASRPGMSFVSLLGRRLDRPMLNFGFSGNGRTELEVGQFLAELSPALFVLDCVANTSAEQIAERTVPFVRLLREKHPTMPILLLEDRTWANAALVPHLAATHTAKRSALRTAFESLRDAGDEHVHYREGDDLLGHDGEATVDGSHPNDLGMMRYADALEPTLRGLIEE